MPARLACIPYVTIQTESTCPSYTSCSVHVPSLPPYLPIGMGGGGGNRWHGGGGGNRYRRGGWGRKLFAAESTKSAQQWGGWSGSQAQAQAQSQSMGWGGNSMSQSQAQAQSMAGGFGGGSMSQAQAQAQSQSEWGQHRLAGSCCRVL
jgi:hypothetical protein